MKSNETFLTKKDVEMSFKSALLVDSPEQAVEVLFNKLNERIKYNKEKERKADVARWIKKEKKDHDDEVRKAREWNKTHTDPEDMWFVPGWANAITYRGTTICGRCFGRKEEPKGDCPQHYWDTNKE